MDQPINLGSPTGLHFVIQWPAVQNTDTAADATRGVLLAYVGTRLVWGEAQTEADQGLIWTWVELLEHLSSLWSRIEWEEADPFYLNCSPDRLRMEAERRWEQVSASIREREEELMWGYEDTHDLASGLSGIWPPALWIQREGNLVLVVGNGQKVLQPAAEVYGTLNSLGESIADRLRGINDARARAARTQWSHKHKVTFEDLISVSTGIPKESISELGSRNVKTAWELKDDFAPNELMAAARMIGSALPLADLGKVLASIRKLPRRNSDLFDEWYSKLEITGEDFAQKAPWLQGDDVASQFRTILNNQDNPIDPEDILREANIPIRNIILPTDQLDAICCWGPQHGPAVLVNSKGKHAQHIRGRRSSLAHEICHLLIDRDGGLPLGEVLGGRVPGHLEARANRFASELLLPRRVAGNAFLESDNDQKTLDHLCRKYGVSKEIVAWQTYNSEICKVVKTLHFLRAFVSRPQDFRISAS